MRDTRLSMLLREAIRLGRFSPNASASHFANTRQTPGLCSIDHHSVGFDTRNHFMPEGCHEAVVPPMVACVSFARPNKVEHHVAGMCPYRTYTWQGRKHGH